MLLWHKAILRPARDDHADQESPGEERGGVIPLDGSWNLPPYSSSAMKSQDTTTLLAKASLHVIGMNNML